MDQVRRDGDSSATVSSQLSAARSPAAQSTMPALPEVQAWPLAVGLFLIAGQCCLAVATGWTATRFLAWPRPGLGYELSAAAAVWLILLGIVTAAVTGRLVWVARRRSRRIATLVNLGAGVAALNLLAWWLASERLGPLIDGPQAWHLVSLAVVWLLLLPVVRLNDLLVSRAAARHSGSPADRTTN